MFSFIGKESATFKQAIFKFTGSILMVLTTSSVFATPYLVHMDNVENLANWAEMQDGVGDLYDTFSIKQVDVSYTERVGFGNTAISAPNPQFWNSLEYGDNHRALFADAGGLEVLEVEITGLNGNLISLNSVIMGRWYPDGINTLDSDWRVYDTNWNLLASGNTLMTDFSDYTVDFNFGNFETIRFQMGDDNWDNGLIAFTYEADVLGTLDLALDQADSPTPDVEGSGPATVPEPGALILLALGLLGLSGLRNRPVAI